MIYIGSFLKLVLVVLCVGFFVCNVVFVSDFVDVKMLMYVSSLEYCECMFDVIVSDGYFFRYMNYL